MDELLFKFEKYKQKPARQARPRNMEVGQVVVRKTTDTVIRGLECEMRKEMKKGKEFSVGYGNGTNMGLYAIRRDK
jgi:hypothetical protein